MKLRVLKIHLFLSNLNLPTLILIGVAGNFSSSLLLSIIASLGNGKGLRNGYQGFGSIKEEFIMAVLLAPLLETIIFQYAIIETFKKKSKTIACLISAVVFALFHLYNPFYSIFAFLIGLMFAYLYCLKNSTVKGLILVFSIHIIYNALVFYLTQILK